MNRPPAPFARASSLLLLAFAPVGLLLPGAAAYEPDAPDAADARLLPLVPFAAWPDPAGLQARPRSFSELPRADEDLAAGSPEPVAEPASWQLSSGAFLFLAGLLDSREDFYGSDEKHTLRPGLNAEFSFEALGPRLGIGFSVQTPLVPCRGEHSYRTISPSALVWTQQARSVQPWAIALNFGIPLHSSPNVRVAYKMAVQVAGAYSEYTEHRTTYDLASGRETGRARDTLQDNCVLAAVSPFGVTASFKALDGKLGFRFDGDIGIPFNNFRVRERNGIIAGVRKYDTDVTTAWVGQATLGFRYYPAEYLAVELAYRATLRWGFAHGPRLGVVFNF